MQKTKNEENVVRGKVEKLRNFTKLQCVLNNSSVFSRSTPCMLHQCKFAMFSGIKLVIYRVHLCCFFL